MKNRFLQLLGLLLFCNLLLIVPPQNASPLHAQDINRSHRTFTDLNSTNVTLAPTGTNVWTSIGPGGGEITALAINPVTPTTVYAGTRSSGVFKSTNGGVSWSKVNNGLTSTSVLALAIDPQTPSTVYMNTGGSGVFKSSNSGASWSAINNGLDGIYVSTLAIDPQTPSTIYIGTTYGSLFKSTNGGAGWFAVSNDLNSVPVSTLAIDPQTPSTIYAGGTDYYWGGVFKSTNGGVSWSAVNNGLTNMYVYALAIDPQTPSTIYAGTDYSGGVFRSTNSGASWSKINYGLDAFYVSTLVIDPQTPSTIYAGTTYDGVFKSSNGGMSWSGVSNGLAQAYVRALAIDPLTPSTIYSGTFYGGVFKSANSGMNWSAVNNELNASYIPAVAIDTQRPGTIYATAYGVGVFKSIDGGTNWNAVNNGLENASLYTLAIDPQTPRTIYGSAGNVVFKSTNGGGSWSAFNIGLLTDDVLELAIDPLTPSTLYAGTRSSGVFKSTNGGESWSAINNGLTNISITALAVDPLTPSTLYTGTQYGALFRSTNGGGSWSVVNGLTHVTELAIDPHTPTTIYAATFSGWEIGTRMVKSTDGGTSWSAINSGLDGIFVSTLAIDPQNPNIVYASTRSDGVFKSTSAGMGWSPFNNGLTTTYVSALAIDPLMPSTVYAGTADGGVFVYHETVPNPFLDIPVNYSNFAQALQGNFGKTPGLVNSWFDHQAPNYSKDQSIIKWNKCSLTPASLQSCSLGESCYDGHSGIDFQKKQQNDPVYAAAPGIVSEVNRNWPTSIGARGSPYGNYVLIDHDNGYATLYGHLRSVESWVNVGTNIITPRAQRIGIIGGTGGFAEHLHFGLYYDADRNGSWEETSGGYSEAVDPFSYRLVQGCSGPSNDPNPWNIPSRYLWKQQIIPDNLVGNSGANLTSPGGNKTVNIPTGALASTLTVEFGDAPPVAGASAQLRTLGQSFLLQVLEWLTGGGSSNAPNRATAISIFNQPVTVQVNYSDSDTQHFDATQLKIYRWDANGSSWVALQTTVDANLKTATAQTTETGSFDLQAPLKCPADTTEIDDDYYSAKIISADGTAVTRLFDIATDQDWLKFDAVGGQTYVIQSVNMTQGVAMILTLFDTDGTTALASDGIRNPPLVSWQAAQTGTYFFRLTQKDNSTNGCTATYQVRVSPFKTTSTSLQSSPNPSNFGESVTFTATVSASGATPTGTVRFKEGAALIGTGTLNPQGVASIETSSLALGLHTIIAEYLGENEFGESTSNVLTQTVNGCATKPAQPAPTKPKNGRTVKKQRVLLNWDDANCADIYSVVIRQSSKKGPKVQTQNNLTISQFKSKILTSGKTYFWRVTASNDNGSAKSVWRSFTVQ